MTITIIVVFHKVCLYLEHSSKVQSTSFTFLKFFFIFIIFIYTSQWLGIYIIIKDPPGYSSTHLALHKAITILSTFPMLYPKSP